MYWQRIHGEIIPFTPFPHAGLFITYLALFLMDGQGQPALLYLVPCTLGKYMDGFHNPSFIQLYIVFNDAYFFMPGVIVILGWSRGELHELWNYGKSRAENLVNEP